MSGRCLRDVWEVLGGVCEISVRCLGGVWEMSERCLGDV